MILNHDPLRSRSLARPQRIIAHLSLEAARIAPRSTGYDALLQDLHQYRLMKCFPAPRGELTRTARFSCGPHGPRAERKVYPDLRWPSTPPRASVHGWRSAPSSIRKILAVPDLEFCCAIRSGSRANGFEFIQSCFDFPPFMVERRQLGRRRRLVIPNRCQQAVNGFGPGNSLQPVFDD